MDGVPIVQHGMGWNGPGFNGGLYIVCGRLYIVYTLLHALSQDLM